MFESGNTSFKRYTLVLFNHNPSQEGSTMRVSSQSGGLSVHAVAGTYVVLLGFDLPRQNAGGC